MAAPTVKEILLKWGIDNSNWKKAITELGQLLDKANKDAAKAQDAAAKALAAQKAKLNEILTVQKQATSEVQKQIAAEKVKAAACAAEKACADAKLATERAASAELAKQGIQQKNLQAIQKTLQQEAYTRLMKDREQTAEINRQTAAYRQQAVAARAAAAAGGGGGGGRKPPAEGGGGLGGFLAGGLKGIAAGFGFTPLGQTIFAATTAAEGFEHAVEGIIEKLKELAKEIGPLQQVRETFEKLAPSRGIAPAEFIEKMRGATQGLVGDLQLYRTANTFLQSSVHASEEDIVALTKATVSLASAQGRDAGEATRNLTRFFVTGHAQTLSYATGIQRAQLMTRGLGQATDQTLRTSLEFKHALEVITTAAKAMGETSGTYQEALQRLGVSTHRVFEELMLGFEKSGGFQKFIALIDKISAGIDWLASRAEKVGEILGEMFGEALSTKMEEFTAYWELLKDIVTDLWELWTYQLKLVREFFSLFSEGEGDETESRLTTFVGIVTTLGEAVAMATAGFREMFAVIKLLAQSSNPFSDMTANLEEFAAKEKQIAADLDNHIAKLEKVRTGRGEKTDEELTTIKMGFPAEQFTIQQQVEAAKKLAKAQEEIAIEESKILLEQVKMRIANETELVRLQYEQGLVSHKEYLDRIAALDKQDHEAKIAQLKAEFDAKDQYAAVEEEETRALVDEKRKTTAFDLETRRQNLEKLHADQAKEIAESKRTTEQKAALYAQLAANVEVSGRMIAEARLASERVADAELAALNANQIVRRKQQLLALEKEAEEYAQKGRQRTEEEIRDELAARNKLADAERKLEQDRLDRRKEQNESAFREGQVSSAQYLEERIQLLNDEFDATQREADKKLALNKDSLTAQAEYDATMVLAAGKREKEITALSDQEWSIRVKGAQAAADRLQGIYSSQLQFQEELAAKNPYIGKGSQTQILQSMIALEEKRLRLLEAEADQVKDLPETWAKVEEQIVKTQTNLLHYNEQLLQTRDYSRELAAEAKNMATAASLFPKGGHAAAALQQFANIQETVGGLVQTFNERISAARGQRPIPKTPEQVVASLDRELQKVPSTMEEALKRSADKLDELSDKALQKQSELSTSIDELNAHVKEQIASRQKEIDAAIAAAKANLELESQTTQLAREFQNLGNTISWAKGLIKPQEEEKKPIAPAPSGPAGGTGPDTLKFRLSPIESVAPSLLQKLTLPLAKVLADETKREAITIDDIAKAIAQAEGFGVPGAIPTVRNNPGDITDAKGVVKKFDTVADGWAALARQIEGMVTGTSQLYPPGTTLKEGGLKYSHGSKEWVNNVSKKLGISPDTAWINIVGSYAGGGAVYDSGVAQVHAGEYVLPNSMAGIFTRFIEALTLLTETIKSSLGVTRTGTGASATGPSGLPTPLLPGGTFTKSNEQALDDSIRSSFASTMPPDLGSDLAPVAPAAQGLVQKFTQLADNTDGLIGKMMGSDGLGGAITELTQGNLKDATTDLGTFGAGVTAVAGAIGGLMQAFHATSPGQGALAGASAGSSIGAMIPLPGAQLVGAAIGATIGAIEGAMREATFKMAERMSAAFKAVIEEVQNGSQTLAAGITLSIENIQQAVIQLHQSSGNWFTKIFMPILQAIGLFSNGAKDALKKILPDMQAQLTQLEQQQAQVLNAMDAQLNVLNAPDAFQEQLTSINSIIQQYRQYVQAGGSVTNANQFLQDSFRNLSREGFKQLNQDEQDAIDNALHYNDLLLQRQELIQNTNQQLQDIMSQGVAVRQMPEGATKARQIQQLMLNAQNQLSQMDEEIAVSNHKLTAEQQIFKLSTTRIGLETQLVGLQNEQTDLSMKQIEALGTVVGGLQRELPTSVQGALQEFGLGAAYVSPGTEPGLKPTPPVKTGIADLDLENQLRYQQAMAAWELAQDQPTGYISPTGIVTTTPVPTTIGTPTPYKGGSLNKTVPVQTWLTPNYVQPTATVGPATSLNDLFGAAPSSSQDQLLSALTGTAIPSAQTMSATAGLTQNNEQVATVSTPQGTALLVSTSGGARTEAVGGVERAAPALRLAPGGRPPGGGVPGRPGAGPVGPAPGTPYDPRTTPPPPPPSPWQAPGRAPLAYAPLPSDVLTLVQVPAGPGSDQITGVIGTAQQVMEAYTGSGLDVLVNMLGGSPAPARPLPGFGGPAPAPRPVPPGTWPTPIGKLPPMTPTGGPGRPNPMDTTNAGAKAWMTLSGFSAAPGILTTMEQRGLIPAPPAHAAIQTTIDKTKLSVETQISSLSNTRVASETQLVNLKMQEIAADMQRVQAHVNLLSAYKAAGTGAGAPTLEGLMQTTYETRGRQGFGRFYGEIANPT